MATSADYRLGDFTFPRGWFMVADAEKIEKKPHCVRFFGKDMVLYRGESGKVYMVSAYCPHMRTHIGKSATSFMAQQGTQIDGDDIRCPYHAWKYGPDGKCNEIPYVDGPPPPNAKLDSYPVVERYNGIFYWHDPEGGEPEYELPPLPEWDDPHRVRWRFDALGSMNLHPIEVVDNICDIQHLLSVHATHPGFFENEIRGHRVWQLLGGKHEILGVDGPVTQFNTYYTGPGILISKFFGDNESMMFITHTPIDDGSVFVWHATLTKIADRIPTQEDIKAARDYQALSLGAFAQDFEIWSNKEPCLRPMQMPADGNFLKVRAWYKQFYNPRSKTREILDTCEGNYRIPGLPGAKEGGASPQILAAYGGGDDLCGIRL